MEKLREVKLISVKDNQFKARVQTCDTSTNDSYETIYVNSTPAHEDLTAALARLKTHVERLSGTYFPNLTIEGYYRQAMTGCELLTIYAALRDQNGCLMSLSVRHRIGQVEYLWIDTLLEDLALCEREALLYIEQGKRLGIERFVMLPVDGNETTGSETQQAA